MGIRSFLQGISPTQGLNPHLLPWQVDSLPLRHLRSPLLLTSEILKMPPLLVSPGHEAGSERARASVPQGQWWTVKTSPGSHHRDDGGQSMCRSPTCASLRPTLEGELQAHNATGRSPPHLLPGNAFTRKTRTCPAWALAVAATAAQAHAPAGGLQPTLWPLLPLLRLDPEAPGSLASQLGEQGTGTECTPEVSTSRQGGASGQPCLHPGCPEGPLPTGSREPPPRVTPSHKEPLWERPGPFSHPECSVGVAAGAG